MFLIIILDTFHKKFLYKFINEIFNVCELYHRKETLVSIFAKEESRPNFSQNCQPKMHLQVLRCSTRDGIQTKR